MKKVIALSLAIIFILAYSTVNVFASDVPSCDVHATYTAGSAAVDTVEIDFEWGDMVFEYKDAVGGTWNPNTYEYDGASPAGWHCEEGANEVTITNHSNVSISVDVTYSSNSAFTGVSGTFNKSNFTINPATVGDSANTAPSETVTLTLSGAFVKPADDSDQGLYASYNDGKYLLGSVNIEID